MYRSWQKLLAEFLGSYIFVFLAAGAVCVNQGLVSGGQPGFGTLGLALVPGLAFAILVSALAPVSGAHFNPAITIGFWVTKRMGAWLAIFYWIAQALGAMAAAYTLTRFLPDAAWRAVSLGTPELAAEFSRTQGILLEALLTFILVFVFFGAVAGAKDSAKEPWMRFGGFAAGLAIFLDKLIGAPFTGASLNPAMAFSTALVSHHWTNHGVYWIGPLLGGVVGGWMYHTLFLRGS